MQGPHPAAAWQCARSTGLAWQAWWVTERVLRSPCAKRRAAWWQWCWQGISANLAIHLIVVAAWSWMVFLAVMTNHGTSLSVDCKYKPYCDFDRFWSSLIFFIGQSWCLQSSVVWFLACYIGRGEIATPYHDYKLRQTNKKRESGWKKGSFNVWSMECLTGSEWVLCTGLLLVLWLLQLEENLSADMDNTNFNGYYRFWFFCCQPFAGGIGGESFPPTGTTQPSIIIFWGWPEPYIHTVYDRVYGNFPAKKPHIPLYTYNCMVLANPSSFSFWFPVLPTMCRWHWRRIVPADRDNTTFDGYFSFRFPFCLPFAGGRADHCPGGHAAHGLLAMDVPQEDCTDPQARNCTVRAFCFGRSEEYASKIPCFLGFVRSLWAKLQVSVCNTCIPLLGEKQSNIIHFNLASYICFSLGPPTFLFAWPL